jgi:hypothetical protein
MRSLLVVGVCLLTSLLRAEQDQAIDALSKVRGEGEGNEAASAAWQVVVKAGPACLPKLVAAAGKGGPVADNWLRLAGDVIVERAVKSKESIPFDALESFVANPSNPAAGRQIAFDLLRQANADRAAKLEPSLANDPVQSLRRGAVQLLIDAAKSKAGEDAKAAFLKALDVVRDEDQTKTIAAELKKLGSPVNLPQHFGFLTKWQVIGPFDNTERKGFDAVYPPEKAIDLQAEYPGKDKSVKWQSFESADEYGKVDLNKPLGMLKEATAYATTTFDSPTEREAEIRLGCKNAWKVWLNGELLFGRDEYHRGQQMDQYKLKCRLKKGTNVILVKACQNEQKEEWTVEWEFQLRLCDSAGTAIASAAATQN